MVDIEFQEILDEYFSSARELVENARNLLAEVEEEQVPSPGRARDLRRALHTLKGNSSMMGFEVVADLSHLMEELLKGVEAGEYGVSEKLVSAVLPGLDLIAEVAASGKVPDETPASWAGVIAGLREAERAVREGPGDEAEVPAEGGPSQAGTEPETGGAEPQSVGSGPAPSELEMKRRYLGHKAETVRVKQSVLDSLVDLAGEMHILLSGLGRDAGKRADGPGDDGGPERIDRLLLVFRQLEQQIVAARMVPVGPVLSRFRALVRDLAAAHGKEISFVLEGEATTVDKAVVDQLGESLLHLVRNAVDHGIETPVEREAAGKPRAARLTLAARQISNRIEIAVVDDGRGIDAGRVRRKALQKGIPVDGLDDRAVLDLIFLPEFSTRDDVTMLSGRGVGLDVVRTSLERFGGTATIQTLVGRGTEFRLTFPLTLALDHCLVVQVGSGTFAIPASLVAATVRIDADARADVDERRELPWRGERVPVLEGRRILQSEGIGPCSSAVILEGGGRRRALLVDRLVEVQDLVVKPLDDAFGKPMGVSGATLLGDGRIVMIVDARELLEARPEAST